MPNLKLEAFIERISNNIENIKHKNMAPHDLQGLITAEDLIKCLDVARNLCEDDSLDTLENGTVVKIDKSKKQKNKKITLPRSIAIQRDIHGEYALILETKSKLENDTKKTPEILQGNYKKGKPSWRIDTPSPEKYVSMVSYIKTSSEHVQIKKEYSTNELILNNLKNTKDLHISYFAEYSRVDPSDNSNIIKVVQYSAYANGDLNKILNKYPVTLEQKNNITSQLLDAIELFHSLGMVHQDIKPPNVLVYFIKDGSIKIKLADFGISQSQNSNNTPLSTLRYESPEISFVYSKDDPDFYIKHKIDNQKKYFTNPKYNSLGRDILKIMTSESALKQNKDAFELRRSSYTKPDKANDMWSLGILLHEMYYGYIPTIDNNKIKQNPLIDALLQPQRENRANIATAKVILKEMITPKPFIEEPLKKSPPTQKRDIIQRSIGQINLAGSYSSTTDGSQPANEAEVILTGKNNNVEAEIMHSTIITNLVNVLEVINKFTTHPEYKADNYLHLCTLKLKFEELLNNLQKLKSSEPLFAILVHSKLVYLKKYIHVFLEKAPEPMVTHPIKQVFNAISDLERRSQIWSKDFNSPLATTTTRRMSSAQSSAKSQTSGASTANEADAWSSDELQFSMENIPKKTVKPIIQSYIASQRNDSTRSINQAGSSSAESTPPAGTRTSLTSRPPKQYVPPRNNPFSKYK